MNICTISWNGDKIKCTQYHENFLFAFNAPSPRAPVSQRIPPPPPVLFVPRAIYASVFAPPRPDTLAYMAPGGLNTLAYIPPPLSVYGPLFFESKEIYITPSTLRPMICNINSTCTCLHVYSDHCHIIEYFQVPFNQHGDWRFGLEILSMCKNKISQKSRCMKTLTSLHMFSSPIMDNKETHFHTFHFSFQFT